MTWTAWTSAGAIRIASALAVPPCADRAAAAIAVWSIRQYQRFLSKRSGRTCLFEPSCSHRAVASLSTLGFNRGIKATKEQFERCGGGYSIWVSSTGSVGLTTADGRHVPQHEISSEIANRLAHSAFHVPDWDAAIHKQLPGNVPHHLALAPSSTEHSGLMPEVWRRCPRTGAIDIG